MGMFRILSSGVACTFSETTKYEQEEMVSLGDGTPADQQIPPPPQLGKVKRRMCRGGASWIVVMLCVLV